MFYYFRTQQQKFDRWENLNADVEAATTLSLSNYFANTSGDTVIYLPIRSNDSVKINKKFWGMLEVASITAVENLDTLKRSFLIGEKLLDSTILYIVDEDRPISISGKTNIQGDAFLPKSGIRPAFVDGEYYDGIKELVDGKILESSRKLPEVNNEILSFIESNFKRVHENNRRPLNSKSVLKNSFFNETHFFRIESPLVLSRDSVKGNIVLICDSAITITSQTKWENAILFAPVIKIENNFNGKGQFFATDSLVIGKDVVLDYPSVTGLIAKDSVNSTAKISIGENTKISGLVFLYREELNEQMDLIELGKNSKIQGNIISSGLFKYSDPLEINGSLYCYRVITERPSSLYENYLINLTMERNKLHPYFIRPYFFSEDRQVEKGIVSWLN
ncbi:hypothetical protein GCM10011516_14410 [Sphingobacterium cellulitidis]|uniref:Uncharacterized protein n=2 Tax=Sphingobacterium cellulitidis TaxID=1768011 RepID=A0A8H9FZ09_9SPHI|nr:hypothetical protein GCM10011516_14410 [Sphingobacterium soli]